MAKKSVSKRIQITRTGKIRRRAMSLGHSRGNKSGTQLRRKKKNRYLSIHSNTVGQYL